MNKGQKEHTLISITERRGEVSCRVLVVLQFRNQFAC